MRQPSSVSSSQVPLSHGLVQLIWQRVRLARRTLCMRLRNGHLLRLQRPASQQQG